MDMSRFDVCSQMCLNIARNQCLALADTGVQVFVNVNVTSYLARSCAIAKDSALKQQTVLMEERQWITLKNVIWIGFMRKKCVQDEYEVDNVLDISFGDEDDYS